MSRRLVSFALSLAILGALLTLPARADDKSDIDAVVRKSMSAFEAGDQKGLGALGAPATQTVMDEFGLHFWSGPTAIVNWLHDFTAMTHAGGDTDIGVRLAPAKFVEIDGKRAWATYPATYMYKEKGVAQKEGGSLVFTLEKVAAGWRILGIAWARVS